MTLVFSGANHSMTPIIPDLLTKLIAAVTGSTVRDRTKAQGALEEALASLGTNVGHSAFPTPRPPRGGLAGWQAKRVARYIDEHIGMPFKASDLAAQVQLSNAHFFGPSKRALALRPPRTSCDNAFDWPRV